MKALLPITLSFITVQLVLYAYFMQNLSDCTVPRQTKAAPPLQGRDPAGAVTVRPAAATVRPSVLRHTVPHRKRGAKARRRQNASRVNLQQQATHPLPAQRSAGAVGGAPEQSAGNRKREAQGMYWCQQRRSQRLCSSPALVLQQHGEHE